MSPCICIDDSNPMFRMITGGDYWNPIIIKSINKGDKVYYERNKTGVNISLTDNSNSSFMFLTEKNFKKYFEDISIKRNTTIKKILK